MYHRTGDRRGCWPYTLSMSNNAHRTFLGFLTGVALGLAMAILFVLAAFAA